MVSVVSLPKSTKQSKYKAEHGLGRKETWQEQHCGKKTIGMPEERDHRVEEARMDKRQPLENMGSQA